MKEREKFGSRLGFILMSAGCAIGCGNVWKFPYLTGENGGGIFVLFYVIFLFLLGIPVMTMEFSLGRASQKSPASMLNILSGTKHWGFSGVISFAGNLILMMFYTVVCGWFLNYFIGFLSGKYVGGTNEVAAAHFGELLGSPWQNIIFALVICALGFFVCSFSLSKGLEQVTKVMMIVLLVLMFILAVRSLMLDGSAAGMRFYLRPDFSKFSWATVNAAMNQAFFTLSLGIGSMAIFGSYIGKERSMMGESLNVIILDTFVAIVAGIIIFPACFTYGIEPGAGPGLIFETLPVVFNNMTGGRIWGSLFFLFMTFAAFSTVLAVFENILSMVRDITGWNRIKGALICGAIVFVLSLPCALGFNVWSGFSPFAAGSTIQDLEDFIVSNLLLPLGSLIFVVFCTWKKGWGWDNFVAEANTGRGAKVQKWMKPYMKYVLPLIIIAVLIIGLVTYTYK